MDFYYMDGSGPCRAVMLTAKAVGVTLNKKILNVTKKEQMTPEFLAINPRHCIPTLVDGDFPMWESRAICTYLVTKYGKDDSLYPVKEPKTRYFIDRYLYFEMSILGKKLGEYVYPVFSGKEKPDPAKLESLHEALSLLENDLKGHKFCVGDTLTVADFVLIPTVSNIAALRIDLAQYPSISAWFDRCREKMVGYETENGKGAAEYGKYFENLI